MLDKHVFFKVNSVEVREYNVQVFTFDQMMQGSRLPISGRVPASKHTISDKHRILQPIMEVGVDIQHFQ